MQATITTDRHFQWKVILAFAMVYIVWGSTFFFIHKALAGFGPFLLGAFRFTTAGLLMLAWCRYKGYQLFNKRTIVRAGLMGLLLLYIDNGIIIWVEQFMPSGLVAIMSASVAIWFIILDKPKWKANFSNLPTIAGLFMGFFGVVMLFGDRVAQSMDASERQANVVGMLLLLLGALAWTVGSLYSKYYGKPETKAESSVVSTAWQMLIAGVTFLLTAAIRGEVSSFRFDTVPMSAWWAIAYLIVFGSVIAYSSYIWLLQVRPATEVSTHTYVNPIVAVLLGVFFANESVTPTQMTGLVVILLSVFLINWDAYNLSKVFAKKQPFMRMRAKVRVRAKIRTSAAARTDSTTGEEMPL
ncbi:EamA family transporter [Parapedobacter tibetensis]|uniref:EamA family transporter n=1 Tax=Parapedobacter tibetensis TaxID=2972951 RepID=UPI00214D1428|nr:EamA family transporter [Parapedobacter tibetensis]